MKNNNLNKILLSCALSLGMFSSVNAEVLNTTFNVRANIINDCTIAATDMDFGDVNLGVGAYAQSTITVACSAAVNGYVQIDGGLHLDATGETTDQRHLFQDIAGSSFYVRYDLYSDPSYSSPFAPTGWDGLSGGVAFSTEGGSYDIPVYGNIPIQFVKPAGVYLDTVGVIVTY